MSEGGDRLVPLQKAAAEYLATSRWTLYREQKAGRIRFVKVRGSTFIRESEIQRYIRARAA